MALILLIAQGGMNHLGAGEASDTAASATAAAQAFLAHDPPQAHVGLVTEVAEAPASPAIIAGSEWPVSLVLANTGAIPVTIREVRLGCACGRVIESPTVLEPGGRGTVRISYQTGPQTGPIRHQVEVMSSDGHRPRLAIPVIGTVVAPVEVSPAAADFGVFTAGSALARLVTITVHQRDPVVITTVRAANPWILPVLHEVERGRRYTVSVTLASTAPAGPIQGQVALDADADPSRQPPSLPITFPVSGRVEPP